ncbi:MAG: hypothetical protein GY868_01245 [Deltaproteobacteria bacterium]|nr:hypothetical protein [Deltaproteobacteria bacterium]
MAFYPGYRFLKINSFHIYVRDGFLEQVAQSRLLDLCRRLFCGTQAELIKQGTYKTIFKTEIDGAACLVKQYRNPGFFKQLKSLVKPARARFEFQAAVHIDGCGIETPVPFLLAEDKRAGMVRAGIVVLPFLTGAVELKDLFFGGYPCRSAEKRHILEQFGRLTAKIFSSAVFQYDYSINNFMLRSEGGRQRLYFIDFERVTTGKPVVMQQRCNLLAKLNRIGREVSLTDRLRFLRSYLAEDSGFAGSLKEGVGLLGDEMVAVLKRDLQRGRLSSIYTHHGYTKFRQDGFAGFSKKGYELAGMIDHLTGLSGEVGTSEISVVAGGQQHRLRAVCLRAEDARAAWARLSLLVIAGMPLELPDVLAEDGRRGFICAAPEFFSRLTKTADQTCGSVAFVRKNFPGLIDEALSALSV